MTDKQEQDTAGVRVRHKKRGSEYEVIGAGKMQAENWQVSRGGFDQSIDMEEVVVYRSVTDPSEVWVRPREEFNDGRFETITVALERCPTCNGTGKEGRHSICRDCDELPTPQTPSE